MADAPVVAGDQAACFELARGADQRHFPERLLELFCRVTGVAGAALYLEGDGGWRRAAAAGESGLPESLPDEGRGFVRIDLPRAKLIHPPPEQTHPVAGALVVAVAAAAQALRLRSQLKRRHFEAAFRGVELEALYDVGLAIASTLDLAQLYEEILLRAASLLDARRGALYLVEGSAYRLQRTFGGPARERLEAGEPDVEALLTGRPTAAGLLPEAEHLLAAPIEVDGSPRGMLVVADKESRRGVGPFPAADRRTLSLFANQAAIALENARLHQQALEKQRLERELELAAEIQRALLPTAFPAVPGCELIGWSRPARHVGGDFYDLVPSPGGRLAFVVADVSGKGMPAALLVSTLQSALRLLLESLEFGPALLERLNRHIFESSRPNRFITMLLGELNPQDGTLRYLNAGHNPALLVRSGGEVEELPPGGLPLGVLPGSVYRAGVARLSPGDLLCVYSDGITECASPDDQEFGMVRLADLLRRHRQGPVQAVMAAVEQAVTEFAGGRPQGDDQTVLMIGRRMAFARDSASHVGADLQRSQSHQLPERKRRRADTAEQAVVARPLRRHRPQSGDAGQRA